MSLFDWMVQTVFNVDMMCGGCEKAVTAMLKKVDGVENVIATHADNKVVVEGTGSSDAMLAAIKKTGKTCSLA